MLGIQFDLQQALAPDSLRVAGLVDDAATKRYLSHHYALQMHLWYENILCPTPHATDTTHAATMLFTTAYRTLHETVTSCSLVELPLELRPLLALVVKPDLPRGRMWCSAC